MKTVAESSQNGATEGRTGMKPDADGAYRWVYEMSLFRNPTFYFLVWKIFFFIILGIFAFVFIIDFFGKNDLLADLKFLGYFLAGMTVVTALGYLLYALVMGGKYIVEFEMTEKGINHKQVAAQAKKAKKIAAMAAIAGLAGGRIGTVGVGINSARTEMYSDFSRVRKVRAYPRRNTIKVNQRLSHNQVYVRSEDFEFVKEFIISHCENLKQRQG